MHIDTSIGVFFVQSNSQSLPDMSLGISWERLLGRRTLHLSTKKGLTEQSSFLALQQKNRDSSIELSEICCIQPIGRRKNTHSNGAFGYKKGVSEARADYCHRKDKTPTTLQRQIQGTAQIHYQMTVAMLNNTMGLCLRWTLRHSFPNPYIAVAPLLNVLFGPHNNPKISSGSQPATHLKISSRAREGNVIFVPAGLFCNARNIGQPLELPFGEGSPESGYRSYGGPSP
jgi:hypothetical protein